VTFVVTRSSELKTGGEQAEGMKNTTGQPEQQEEPGRSQSRWI
jgi:hypothetical protein